ncbi:hypothetical protein BV378_02935 [Nostoc sp. RF31YmG]|nr:hypothetical protein BV378_02935 [Nostoc sp. RF31YmG]
MSTIKISNLHLSGTELFNVSESFLCELTDQENVLIQGGTAISQVTYSIGLVSDNNNAVGLETPIELGINPETLYLLT